MRENEPIILEQYDIDVKNTRKVRDAVLCESRQGLFLVKELHFSEKRLRVLEQLSEHLRQRGCDNIDWILKTKEGELFCTAEDGTKYFLKRWFAGKECDIHREKDVLEAVSNLTKVHVALQGFETEEEGGSVTAAEDLIQEYFRHNRELKKVRTFMRNKVDKGDFELAFLKHFDSMYATADSASKRLEESNYKELLIESRQKNTLIHGDYNYHNILLTYGGIATTNFEHVQRNIQITDFYYFLRKVMEKNCWDTVLGHKMLNCYQKYIPLKKGELEYIAICLAYPEKFWKAANSYYRSRKVWIPAKNLEKLELAIQQTEKKKEFLKTIFAFHL